MENVIKKNRGGSGGWLVPESHLKPVLGFWASLEKWLGFRDPRPHPLVIWSLHRSVRGGNLGGQGLYVKDCLKT